MASPFDNCKECRFYGCGQANMPCRACCFGSKFERAFRRTTIPKLELNFDVSKLLPTERIIENVDKSSVYPDTMNTFRMYCRNDVEYTKTLIDFINKRVEAKMKIRKTVPEIKDVIFNEPATIVLWEDGTKTVVKAQGNEAYDPEKGLAMAICKKLYGNTGSYNNVFSKYTQKYYTTTWNEKIAKRDIQKATAKIEDAMNVIAEAARKFAK